MDLLEEIISLSNEMKTSFYFMIKKLQYIYFNSKYGRYYIVNLNV